MCPALRPSRGARRARRHRRVRHRHRHPRRQRHPLRGRDPGQHAVGHQPRLLPVDAAERGAPPSPSPTMLRQSWRRSGLPSSTASSVRSPTAPATASGSSQAAGVEQTSAGAVPHRRDRPHRAAPSRGRRRPRRGDPAGGRHRLPGRLRRDGDRRRSQASSIYVGACALPQIIEDAGPAKTNGAIFNVEGQIDQRRSRSRLRRSTPRSSRPTATASTQSAPAPSPSAPS